MGLCSHPQPPLVQTQRVTITAGSNSLPSGTTTTEVPVVPTKTIIYESSKVGAPAPAQPRSKKLWAQRHEVWVDQALRLQAQPDVHHLDWCELAVTFSTQTLNRLFLLAGVRWRDRKRQHDYVQLHERYLGDHQWHHHHNNHHSHLKGERSTLRGWTLLMVDFRVWLFIFFTGNSGPKIWNVSLWFVSFSCFEKCFWSVRLWKVALRRLAWRRELS